MGRAKSKAPRLLRRLYRSSRNWRLVAESLGLNKGLVYAVAKGQRKPTPQVCRALHLPYEGRRLAPVCPKHGVPHPGRCPRIKSPEQKQQELEQRQAQQQACLRRLKEWTD